MGFTPYSPTMQTTAPAGGTSAQPAAAVPAQASGFTSYSANMPAPVQAPTPAEAPAPTPSQIPIAQNHPDSSQQISDAAGQGIASIKEGFSKVEGNGDIATPLEAGLDIGSGAVKVASSPLAPLFSPIGKFIGYISDKLASHPAVQQFAQSPAGEATARIAGDVSKASDIAGAVAGTDMSAPVEDTLNNAASRTADATGSGASQILGSSTGSGASSVKAAFNGGQAFLDAMRGKTSPDQIIDTAQSAVENIADSRRTDYLSSLQQLGENTKSLDISPIQDTLAQKLQDFGVKTDDEGNLDFSRSSIANNGTARTDVQGVYNTLKDWGTQTGDRTPDGLDTLKKQLTDFYSPSGSARALVQAVKGKVSDILNTQVPGYKDMTSKYAATSQLLDDIKSATGVGGKAKADTVFTKLTTAMKSDKEFRLQMLNEMQSKGAAPDLMDQIAGINMSSIIPKGLVGKGADIGAAFAVLGHYFEPQYIPMLLATSPRVVGEFAHAMGMTANAVSSVVGAVNKASATTIAAGAAAAPQATQPQTSPAPDNQ